MKKIFLVLFSFLFIGTVLAGSCFLLSGCDQSYSQNENSENNENYNDNNTDEDEEIEASGYYFHAYLISFDEQNPSGANNTNGGSVIVSGPGAFGLWADSPHGKTLHMLGMGQKKIREMPYVILKMDMILLDGLQIQLAQEQTMLILLKIITLMIMMLQMDECKLVE